LDNTDHAQPGQCTRDLYFHDQDNICPHSLSATSHELPCPGQEQSPTRPLQRIFGPSANTVSSSLSPVPSHLINEINTKAMQNQTPKHKIRKSPLTANPAGIVLDRLSRFSHILRGAGCCRGCSFACLHAEGGCEDELANARAEARKESVEWLFRRRTSLVGGYVGGRRGDG
jgi:hypothetical protein